MEQNWTVIYYNERVKRDVLSLPAGILADYLRLLDLMREFGADLRMPHSRAMGADCLSYAQRVGRYRARILLYARRAAHCCAALVREEDAGDAAK